MAEELDRCLASGMTSGMSGFLAKPRRQQQEWRPRFMSESEKQSVVFDQITFLANFSGMEDLAMETIRSFISTLPALIAAIDQAIQSGKARDLELSAHTLKGAASNFYAEGSKRLAWQLEKIGHEGRTNGAEPIFMELKIELDRLSAALSSLVNSAGAA